MRRGLIYRGGRPQTVNRRGVLMVALAAVLLALGVTTMRLPMSDPDQSTVLMLATFPLGLFLLVDGLLLLARGGLQPNDRRNQP